MSQSIAQEIAELSEEDQAAALEGVDAEALLHDWDF